MSDNPRVSVVLINWNQPDLTAACLRSLRAATYDNIEAIVVDNGSADDSIARLSAEYPEAIIIAAGENLGFTGGNNLGIQSATGEFVMLLNNDTEVAPGFLEPIIAAAQADPAIGALGPKIRYFDRPDVIQYAGGHPIDLWRGRGGWRGWGEMDRGQYPEVEETYAAHGAAFVVRRSVLEEVGALDASLFIFYEELDWSVRIRKAGFKIVYVPDSVVFHKESMTTGKVSPFRTYYMTRNRTLFMRRHASPAQKAVFLSWLLLGSTPLNTTRDLRIRRRDLLRARLEGLRDGLRHPGLGNAGAPTGRDPARRKAA